MWHLPLGALRGFEAAARLKSFTAAADELNLTQSAVSHQIRTLEDAIGVPLFVREHRTVRLTDAGFEFWRTVRESLKRLDHGVQRVHAYSKPTSLIVAAEPAFASRWLVPRLPDFRARHPEIDVWLYSTDRDLDLETDEIDIVIERDFDSASAQGANALFSEDWVTPHCSAALAARLRQPEDIKGEPLLHDERDQDWAAWCTSHAVEHIDTAAGPSFSDAHHSLSTAEDGHGLVLASWLLASGARERGALVTPFPEHRLAVPGYVMTVILETTTSAMTQAFEAWIQGFVPVRNGDVERN
ncbi:MAG: LysR family transcriptional regulator [Alphaproteobacteria bacterium]|nr:LysR family transcriptional regulator [Rhodospirillaceae bacterium]MBT7647143.1 LysR family transcriptional regulator [Rhodospirillaceae bacterium]MDG2479846.1 LysR family transcriptional regulator [Alphaproteobacteria bacterium]